MGKLFGTDGVRGVANIELTCEISMQIGRAAATVLTDDTHRKPRVLIGKDTRLSSDMLEAALAAGLCSVGADVLLLGVLPTPAVAFLVAKYGYDAGVMISASHNPCEFNGIKIFKSDGYKLEDAIEDEIERLIFEEPEKILHKNGDEVGIIRNAEHSLDDYIDHLVATAPGDFQGLNVALDCANGSASVTAEKLFTRLGATCHVLHAEPDGININENCGSTHMGGLQQYVKEHGCDVGLAFDGDADRMLAVDENGNVVDGDQIMAICAKDRYTKGELPQNTCVVTVMSNMGFFKFCTDHGMHAEVTKVGDRYVLEKMLEKGYCIGGEQSGHVIFLDYATTGDGQLSAIQLLRVLKSSGKKLSELASVMRIYPQTLINVRVTNEGKARYDGDEVIQETIKKAEAELGEEGRVLVRMSGTEPLIRVMLEGKDEAVITMLGTQIAETVQERLS